MLSGIKQQGVVGKNGKIEIQTPELAEGTLVEVIVLTEQSTSKSSSERSFTKTVAHQDTTAYLLSTEANRRHLTESIEQAKDRNSLVTFTPQEWDEEYNVHS